MNSKGCKRICDDKTYWQKIAFVVCASFYHLTISAQLQFKDIAEDAGIVHQYRVFEGLFGGAACVFDLNNDGFEDLYITGGLADDQLLVNTGMASFINIFDQSGMTLTRKFVTLGVASADVNRDGWVDIFITTSTRADSVQVIPQAINLLFLNNGDSTFRDATAEYGLDQLYAFSTGASFGDVNGDGYPDLYVGNYFLDYDGPLTEINDATIVNASRIAKGYLLINQKGNYFKNEYDRYGLNHSGFGFGGLFTDYDNDGDQDIIVNHDFGYKATPNYVLKNEYPRKIFTYAEVELGLDLRINAMSTALADVNEDGFLDYFFTNIKFNKFMLSQGVDQAYMNKAKELGTHIFTISWGAHFQDFDHDGDVDLYVVNGDLNPNCTAMGNFLFENKSGKFEDVARLAGVNDYGIGRGSVVFDMENDGDLDILVINQNPIRDYPDSSRTKLFINELQSPLHWAKVKLVGVQSESRGLGSRVEIVTKSKRQIREIDGGGSSHISQNSALAHFGLGVDDQIDSLIVRWTGGDTQILLNPPIDSLIIVIEETKSKQKRPYMLMALSVLIALFVWIGYKRRLTGN